MVFALTSEQSEEICFNALNFVVNCMDVKSYFDRSTEMLTEVVAQIVIAFETAVFDILPSGKQHELPIEMYQHMIGKKQYDARPALEAMPNVHGCIQERYETSKGCVKANL